MKNCETINSSIVFLDNNTIIVNNQSQQPIKINNPFTDLANKLVLSNAYNTTFEEQKNIDSNINKIFTSENYEVIYNLFPVRFEIIQKKKKKDEDFLTKTLSFIQNANICDKIGRIGFNFVFFTIELENIKEKVLKDDFAKNYNGFAISFAKEIDDYLKLTIRLSEAIKNNQQDNTQTKGMIIDANFEQVINQENTIDNVFNEDYNKLVEDYIKNIF